jgi:hypothetical protein
MIARMNVALAHLCRPLLRDAGLQENVVRREELDDFLAGLEDVGPASLGNTFDRLLTHLRDLDPIGAPYADLRLNGVEFRVRGDANALTVHRKTGA